MKDLVARVAARHLAAQDDFKVGDEVLFGKYKNKRGKVVRLFEDERGIPSVEIEPVPKGRKQNRVVGLYKIWKADRHKEGAEPVGAGVVVLDDEGRVLLLRRGSSAPWMPGKWNLPGGGIDDGESPEAAARREAKEEARISVGPMTKVADVPYPDGVTRFFLAKSFTGTPKMNWEHDRMEWVAPADLSKFSMVPQLLGVVRRALASAKTAGYSREFLDSVKGQRFRNPDTGNDVVFHSLPATERRKVYERWKGSRKSDEMPLRTVEERGRKFETGTPVEFEYLRNTEKAPRPPKGSDPYQQKIEPAGFYVTLKSTDADPLPGYETGTVKLENPLVLALNTDPEGSVYDDNSWKAQLERRYGKRGKALTKALQDDGYDGIVTVEEVRGKPYTSEIVVFDSGKSVQKPDDRMKRAKEIAEMGYDAAAQLDTDELDQVAFGMRQGVQEVPLSDLKVKYDDDLEQAEHAVGREPERWVPHLDEPIEVSLQDGELHIEDGHHRYVTAQRRGLDSVKIDLTIKDNPVKKIFEMAGKKASMQREACIIAGRRFGDSLCLIKNRDRAYDAELEIVHLEKDGVEMAVVLDTVTGYLEGVNEHGIAAVNTTLMVVRDEAEGKKAPKGKKKPLTSKDGPKIFRALAHDNIDDAVESLRTDDGGIRGHTFVADGEKLYSIECSRNHPAHVTELDPERVNTRTNHGVSYPDAGYTHGDDYVSSIVRRWEAQKRLQDVRRPEAAAVALVEAIHDPDSAFNPVRVTDKMRTTSQLTIDTTNPALLLYLIPDHAKVVKRRNLLPDGREPKIPVRVFRYRNKMEEREPELGKTAAERVAARYKSKKKVKTKDGDEMTVYEYSDRQVADRNRKKAERVEKLRQQMKKLQTKVRKDVKSKDEKTRDLALAVGLMDETFERIGNDDSAKDGHFGVTTWRVKHVRFSGNSATISYVGKSGVDHKKKITNARIVSALKAACEDKKPNDCVLSVSAEEVNEYLAPLDITAKDIRGFHANREMKEQLRAVRKGKLPEDKKEREKKLKDEFKKALEATADAVGHEPSTLRSQYLVPGLEDDYMKDGTVNESHTKKGSETPNLRTAAMLGTDTERRILGNAVLAPVLVGRSRRWWIRNAPNIYRIAREHERPRPSIEGLEFDPDFFTILWYEDADGNRLGGGMPDEYETWEPPEGSQYMHSQFPHVLRHSVLRLEEDGTSTDVGAGEASYPEDLVNAMVRSEDWDVGDAIMVAANSCERCLNVLCDHYGLDDGYPFGSEEYWKCGTRCDLCEGVDNSPEEEHRPRPNVRSAAPSYESYVKRKRREGGPVLTRDEWEAKVMGVGEEAPAQSEPPSREDWDARRKAMMEEYGLSKFHAGYRPQDRHMSIDLIEVAPDQRGSGNASRAMKDALDWADSNGVTVTLTPTSEFGSSKKRLESWYRSMGFVPNKGRNKDYRFQDAMIRTPQAKTATKSDAEREDEAVQKMLRTEPKKKPPRYDLRDNRTLDEEDEEDDLGGGDDGDRDLSMKWNKVARRVALRHVMAEAPKRPEAPKPPKPPAAEQPKQEQPKQQPKSGPSFDEWVQNQKFKHPETGNDVGFTSLPPEEQAKIREKWKGQQQQEQEGGGAKGKGTEESKDRTTEDVQVELSQARDEMRDIEAQMEDLTDGIKDLKGKIKQTREQYLPHMQDGPGKEKIVDSIKKMQRELGRKQDELDDKKDEHKDAKARVDELRRERKDPGFAKEKRDKKLREERAKRVERAVSRAHADVEQMLGRGSQLPPDLVQQIGGALDGLDEAQVESFSIDFQDTLKNLKQLDPTSDEAIETAARAAKFGDLHGLSDPKDLAERLAQLSYAQNVVGNPMNIGGTPVGVTEMDADKYSERAEAAFRQFQNLPSSLRRRAADQVARALQGLDPESNRAQELNAVLTGMNIAQVATTGESLPGRPQPSKGMAALISQMVKSGKGSELFKTSEDYFAEQARRKMRDSLEDMSPEDLGDLVTGGDPEHGFADIATLIKSEGTPAAMREMMMDFLIQDVLNDQWGDRAVRDTMQAAGIADADDPDKRAEVLSEAADRMKPRMEEVLAAQERISEAARNGEQPDAEDVDLVAGVFDPEKGTGLREKAKALLDTIRDKFDRVVISPASAMLNHFVQTGEREALEQETLPHPDEQAKTPRPKEEREQARAEGGDGEGEAAPKTPRERMVSRVRLKAERAKLRTQREKVKPEEKAKLDEKIKALDEEIGKLSEPASGDREKSKAPADGGGSGGDAPGKGDKESVVQEFMDYQRELFGDGLPDDIASSMQEQVLEAMDDPEYAKSLQEQMARRKKLMEADPEKFKREEKRVVERGKVFSQARERLDKMKAQRDEASGDERAKLDKRIERFSDSLEEASEGLMDEVHGPGDVWATMMGNWRAKNDAGNAKSFKSREEANRYAGRGAPEEPAKSEEPKPSGGGEAPGEEFSADFSSAPTEERGPTRFATERVAQAWLEREQQKRMATDWFAHVRSFHPDDPRRPIVVLDAA